MAIYMLLKSDMDDLGAMRNINKQRLIKRRATGAGNASAAVTSLFSEAIGCLAGRRY